MKRRNKCSDRHVLNTGGGDDFPICISGRPNDLRQANVRARDGCALLFAFRGSAAVALKATPAIGQRTIWPRSQNPLSRKSPAWFHRDMRKAGIPVLAILSLLLGCESTPHYNRTNV